MKYIKLFENHEYYIKISEDDFVPISYMQTIPFTEKEYKIIYDLFKSKDTNNKLYINYIKFHTQMPKNIAEKSLIEILYRSIDPTSKNILYEIWKFEDEWLYIEDYSVSKTHNRVYKCDQFDGLIACIKNIYR